MKKLDLVKLINDKPYSKNNLSKDLHGIIVDINDSNVLALFFNPQNIGDYAVVEINKKDIVEEKEKIPENIKNEIHDKLDNLLLKSKDYLEDVKIKEYDLEPTTLHCARPHTSQDLKIYKRVVQSWNKNRKRLSYTDLPKKLQSQNNTSSFLDRFKVVASELSYSQTVVAHISKDGHYFIHPDINQNRSLTPREVARLQTFPDNYYFESASGRPSRTAAFKQIGNAVPVLLAEKIATALLEVW